MGHGSFCSALNCRNSKKRNPDKSFFRFPLDPNRSKKWVINCRRQDLLQKHYQYLYKNCCLCSDHFEPQCFLNDLKNRLQKTAVPTIFDIPNPPKLMASKRRKLRRNDNSTRTYSEKPPGSLPQPILTAIENVSYIQEYSASAELEKQCTFKDVGVQTESYLTSSSPRKQNLKRTCHKLRVTINSLRKKQFRPSVVKKLTIDEIVSAAKWFLPDNVLTFFAAQMKLAKRNPKGRRYSSCTRRLLLSIYFHSPRAYRFLSKYFIFPHKTTLARWMKEFCNTGPQVTDQIMECLKLKVETMQSNDKLCIVCMDEVALKPNFSYDRKSDQVIGFQDLGNSLRNLQAANSALVFMARGITTNWKQPLGYVLTCGSCKGDRIRTILLSLLEKLETVGLLVKAVISDQGSNFLQLYSSLGVTEDYPFFENSNKTYFVLFDFPHLLKSIRNNFSKYDIHFGCHIASWKDVSAMYSIDVKKQFRSAPKLTEKHITLPAFSKMKVSLAANVLSHTVASTIESFVAYPCLPASAVGTAIFCSEFDNIFDCVNSNSLYDVKDYRKAISPSSAHVKCITDFIDWIGTCKFVDQKNDVTHRIKSVKGWKLSLKSLLMLWENLHKEHNLDFLLTRRLNQDCLENFFGSVRNGNGCNVNPTPIQFCRTFKQLAFEILMTSQGKNSNCSPDKDNVLLSKLTEICHKINLEKDKTIVTGGSSVQTTQPSFILSPIPPEPMNLPEKNAFIYVCGFLLKKCLNEHSCSDCNNLKQEVSLESNAYIFLYFKQYENAKLVAPSEMFVSYIQKLEKTFVDFFQKNAHRKNIGSYLYEEMMKVECFLLECFPKCFLIKYFIRMRIHYTLKFINKTMNVKEIKQQKFFQVNCFDNVFY